MNSLAKKIITATSSRILNPLNKFLLLLTGQDEDTINLIQERWNKDAVELGKHTWPGRPCPEDLEMYREIFNQLRPQKILILGATPELRDLACEVTREPIAIADLSLVMLHEMARFVKKADPYKEQWYFANWLSLPVSRGSYDLVIGDYSVKQVAPHQRPALLEEIRRILTPGGFFLTRNHFINPRWQNSPLDDIAEKLAEYGITDEEMKQIIMYRLYDRWVDQETEAFSSKRIRKDEEILHGMLPNSRLRKFPAFDAAIWVQEIINKIKTGRERARVNLTRRWSPTRHVFHQSLNPYFDLLAVRYGTRGEDHEWSPIELFQKKMNTIFERKMRHEFVTFREPLITKEEVAVAQLLKTYFEGLNKRDIPSILSLFAKDASINPLLARDTFIGVDEYGERLKKTLPKLNFTAFDNVRINVSGEYSSAQGEVSILLSHLKPHQGIFSADCKLVNGHWQIVQTKHHPL